MKSMKSIGSKRAQQVGKPKYETGTLLQASSTGYQVTECNHRKTTKIITESTSTIESECKCGWSEVIGNESGDCQIWNKLIQSF
jgi:hypothetical protein